MKIFNAIFSSMKKTDNTSVEHLEKNRIRSALDELCNKYLDGDTNVLEFEALPKALPYVVAILEEPLFLERYEFEQVSESIFRIRAKEIDLLGV